MHFPFTFVKDMVEGLEAMEGQSGQNLPVLFRVAFRGCRYVPSTFHKAMKIYTDAKTFGLLQSHDSAHAGKSLDTRWSDLVKDVEYRRLRTGMNGESLF